MPAGDVTNETKAAAPAGSADEDRTAIGYTASAFHSGGMSMPSTLSVDTTSVT